MSADTEGNDTEGNDTEGNDTEGNDTEGNDTETMSGERDQPYSSEPRPVDPDAPHILLGVSGAIAAYKSADIVRALRRRGARVTPAVTVNAQQFVTPYLLSNLADERTIVDQYAPDLNAVHHVDLALHVRLLLVAPASADILARMATGLASDFITAFHLATPAPVLVAPAMNTRMWLHPATQHNVATLRSRGVRFIGPVEGELATFHAGVGRLAEPEDIADEAMRAVLGPGPLAGEVVVVTAGRTEEDIDLARTLSNRSSGRMGYALAERARDLGAATVLISGPSELTPPSGVELHRVRSAAEMHEVVMSVWERATVVVMTAAVADFKPKSVAPRKIHKDEATAPTIELERTVDILAALGQRKGGRVLVGFAAEDSDVEQRAREKLVRKQLDLVVGNDISRSDVGFAAPTNDVIILGADGAREEVSKRPKREVAAHVLAHVVRLVTAGRSGGDD